MKKFVISILVCLTAFTGLTGCQKATTPKSTAENTLNQPLNIGVLFIEDNLPFFIAEQEGAFEKAGLKVKLIPFQSAAERDAALQAGQIDGEAADLVAAALLKKGGTDVRISSITLGATPQEGRFVLLAAPGSNITRVEELKNVPIAVSENTIIEYITDQLLLGAGFAPAEIKKISVPKMPIRLQMLTNNQVKAALLPDPLASLAEKQGAQVIIDDTKIKTNVSQVVLLFRKDAIDKKRAAIKKLVQVYSEAARNLTRNPDKYRSLLIEKAKIPDPIKDTYKSPTFSKPTVPSKEDIDRVLNWMVGKKLLDKKYSYDEMVDVSLLK
ncbi:NLPA lipoprotein [Thermincola ferriacetica]|uniref:NLPA lipoprotein n=1 Tax=Thermincola ferriacetica TaxID=281456 RepID=A0A0L6W129_9FIRM|nr:MetQ/NlpA family ABC transporter substrate-binding protein [Thermincola ferriacetica]KNZ69287.1 NLPA lipoprotein [Thermincola ferriacetica]